MFLDFREYLDYLEKKALLARIKKEVETSWTWNLKARPPPRAKTPSGTIYPEIRILRFHPLIPFTHTRITRPTSIKAHMSTELSFQHFNQQPSLSKPI